MGIFERYLSVWVGLSIVLGVVLDEESLCVSIVT
jgi:ACR3 family arsenite efflux pump ArsB